ncbi:MULTISPECIES: hypothetical protein [unclassified Modestobacter]|uniref:hypothetical protein n=1 Tax=unclassified Modestobacter TaxID=2643866 RepID=UPI0022AAE574|nr:MULTISPECIES: hypothetical protein [unclassified Modestobacter]MCZ2812676.1 hypothetical protein [Modestobacter sp. VKM Ac-2979]MCZ2841566.1 hypothetical protein [Modestobacter sp. VKM Ac-2980]MCZ2850717.1 hypothetical protein [Modestobacter sp. VKM Ac-2978]
MSRLSRTRVAVVTGLTLGTASAGLLLAPAALAAPAAPSVAPSSTLAPGATFTISGADCTQASDTDAEPMAVITPDSDDPGWGDGGPVNADGTWTLELDAPAEVGTYSYRLFCDQYTTDFQYPNVTITVTADGKPAPAPAPAAFVPGATPNTPGISVTKNSTTSNVAKPGQQITHVLKGFKPNEKVTLVLHSTPVTLGVFTADANGVLTATYTLPAGTTLANHTLAFDGDAGSHYEIALTLTADGKALAYTGASVTLPLVAGTVLVGAGAGALVLSRRRTAGATQA